MPEPFLASQPMKIFTIDNVRAIERINLETRKASIEDMSTVIGEKAAAEIASRWRPTRQLVVFAGPGNNGAYALSTTRQLLELGFRPSIYLFNINGMKINPLCRHERDRLMGAFPSADFTEVTRDFHVPELSSRTLVLDGLFGAGLQAPLEGGFQSLVRYINESGAAVVSIDLPSGLFPDWNPHALSRNIIHASLTLALQFPHPSYFFAENAELVGEWKTLELGYSDETIRATPTSYHLVELAEVRNLLRPRPRFCSKATFGDALIIGGSQGMMGAPMFAAAAALRSGAGKVTLHVPQCGLDVAQTRVPEALCRIDAGRTSLTDILPDRTYDAYGVGPGMGTANATVAALEKFIKNVDHPLVLDADALNCIAEMPSLLNFIPKLSVITPHAGEFDRLFGAHTGDEARIHKALEMSRHYNILIVLKGHYTALVRPDGKVYFNSSGTPALATPGSGDVLTGIITSLMAQGYKPEVSALMGVFIHGRAGEIASRTQGQFGVLASDVVDSIGPAIKEIMQQ